MEKTAGAGVSRKGMDKTAGAGMHLQRRMPEMVSGETVRKVGLFRQEASLLQVPSRREGGGRRGRTAATLHRRSLLQA